MSAGDDTHGQYPEATRLGSMPDEEGPIAR